MSSDERPLIVQSDRTVLLQTGLDASESARDGLSLFAELIKSPEHVHTYRITPLSLWNAASTGVTADEVISTLVSHSRFEVPAVLIREVRETLGRWGRLRLVPGTGDDLVLESADHELLGVLARNSRVAGLLGPAIDGERYAVSIAQRGRLKQALIRVGWPVEDLAGYVEGEPLAIALRPTTRSQGQSFAPRPYQEQAVGAFWAGGSPKGGSGVVVLPCGAGKTLVGLMAMERLATSTLVLTTSVSALRQWRDELLERTDLRPEQIGEYSGAEKTVAPVTLSTYQILTYRRRRSEPFLHFDLFRRRNWGLIIYDEVHLLPAPVFRVLAEIQARRRLGLTATLVREDGRQTDVFSLIGPKKFDVPWRQLESMGFIASAECVEVRVGLPKDLRRTYYSATDRESFRLASTNPEKDQAVRRILDRHAGEQILVIGHYLAQLKGIAQRIDAPLLTGATQQTRREELYASFRRGEIQVLVVSRVANFAIDLPDASVAIQVSGTFGSRQEEAQRLGRILRPKPGANTARFYTLVSRDTVEVEFARRRQIFLAEQGYSYLIEDNAAEPVG
ncbi:MAG: DNA repair helicase XPB [Acidobacteriota bacterium]